MARLSSGGLPKAETWESKLTAWKLKALVAVIASSGFTQISDISAFETFGKHADPLFPAEDKRINTTFVQARQITVVSLA